MKVNVKHMVPAGLAVCLITGSVMLFGNSFSTSDESAVIPNDKKVRTNEVFAGSASFMRENIEVKEDNEESKNTVSDVSVAAGSANTLTATVENAEVPVVMSDEVTEQPVEVTEQAAQPEEQSQPDEWSNKVMAKVEEEANIRANADAEGELVGHLPQGASADIVERGEEWTQISSGSVTGFVKNDYLAFNDEAKQIADTMGKKATVNTETLRVRKEANEESEVVSLASVGDSFKVVSEDVSWVAVSAEDTTGFVAAEYVTISYNLKTATSVEEERAEEQKVIERAKAAEEKAAQKAKKNIETTKREAVMAEADETTLLAALIQVEAGGQSYECQLAVGSVIINRVNSSRFPNSISGVIYQSGQFPGAHNGKVARVISNGVKRSCINAANEVLSGTNNIGNYLFFNTSSAVSKGKLNDYIVIDGECFY